METQPSLFDLTFDELQTLISGWGEPAFRARQIWEWSYHQVVDSYGAMTNLPKPLRGRLAAELAFNRLTPHIDLLSTDGWTRKILFALPDGSQIETVLMGYEARRTVCVSTQAGCAMACPFCATGQGGFQRNLTSGEIVEQVLCFERLLRKDEGRKTKDERRTSQPASRLSDQPTARLRDHPTNRLTNIVFMGMGEPFANYAATIDALRRLIDPSGWNFGARRITVSTVGLIPGIEKFARDGGQVNLAVSIHAATDDLRDQLVPINKRYPLGDLIEACRAYVETTRRRLSFEWALIEGVNDTLEQARALARRALQMPKGLIHVNLIPLNPTRDYAGAASRRERIASFRAELDRRGIPNTLRIRRGIDINAGCGQLRQSISGY
ncbi:MAG: 23S rRNA (adenine(2503)-C(2))-methyltransferase RlmN [Anaerolineae bacterium]